jgi:predicted site-specific integrase-resolvase
MKRGVTCGNDTELLAAKDAAELLPGSASYQSLLRWARQGKVPFVRLPSGRLFFRRSDIDAPLPGFEVEAVPA